jgi:hypothetical protein
LLFSVIDWQLQELRHTEISGHSTRKISLKHIELARMAGSCNS